MRNLVDNAGGDPGDQIVGEAGPVGGHEIVRGDGAKRDRIVIGAFVAHDTDALDAGQDGEILIHMAAQPRGGDLLPEDGVAFPHDFSFLRSDLPDDPDGDSGTGEGLAPDEFSRQAQGFAQGTDLVLEQHAQRFDELREAQLLRQAAHIVVTLDDGCVGTLAALDHVRIDGALGKVVHLSELSGFRLKYFDKVPADNMPFFLRLGDALQIREEAVCGVGPDEADREEMTEHVADLVALTLAQESVIHEDAGEPFADSPVDQGRNDGGIHSAGEGEEDGAGVSDRLPDLPDSGFRKGAHGPAPGAAAEAEQEVADQHAAFLGMRNLRMELDAADFLFLMDHGGDGAVVRLRDDSEARGASADLPGMAHPAAGGALHAAEETGLFLHPDRDPAVFPFPGSFHGAAQQEGGQLHTVADAKYRNPCVIQGGVDSRRTFIMDAGGTAGQDDALRTAGKDVRRRGIPGDYF